MVFKIFRGKEMKEMSDDVFNRAVPLQHLLVVASALVGVAILNSLAYHDLDLELYLLFIG